MGPQMADELTVNESAVADGEQRQLASAVAVAKRAAELAASRADDLQVCEAHAPVNMCS